MYQTWCGLDDIFEVTDKWGPDSIREVFGYEDLSNCTKLLSTSQYRDTGYVPGKILLPNGFDEQNASRAK
jgi:hypothetical protein